MSQMKGGAARTRALRIAGAVGAGAMVLGMITVGAAVADQGSDSPSARVPKPMKSKEGIAVLGGPSGKKSKEGIAVLGGPSGKKSKEGVAVLGGPSGKKSKEGIAVLGGPSGKKSKEG